MTNTTYYLSTQGPFGNGLSPIFPFDVSTQAKLDNLYATLLNQGSENPSTSVTLTYLPGTYLTSGWGFPSRTTAFSGNYHVGYNRDTTTIRLAGAVSQTADGTIFAPNGNKINGFGCSNLTFDCNATNQPKWTGAGGQVNAIALNAAKNVLIQNCKFINFGTATMGIESFPLSIFANPITGTFLMSNVVIDSCIFTQPVTGNKDGCTCAGIVDAYPSVLFDNTCQISNCSFVNCLSDFSFCHCGFAPTFINNFGVGSNVGFYAEPVIPYTPTVDFNVSGNTFVQMDRMFYILTHPGAVFPALTLSNNLFLPLSTVTTPAMQITGGGNVNAPTAVFPNGVFVENNTVNSAGSTNANALGLVIAENGIFDLILQYVAVSGNKFYNFPNSLLANIIKLDGSPTIRGQLVQSNLIGNM